MTQPIKNRRKTENICTRIRQRASPYCFGIKSKAGNPVHMNKNEDIKCQFQCLKMGWYGRHLSRLKNADMWDHFSGKKTHYFTSDGRSMTAEVLINIDIDCHKFGTLEGAIAFAEHLKATRFPNMYYEASTNGKGVHGYIVVIKGDLGDLGLNGALSILDRWLKAELPGGNWDVENVEVKGHCPEFTWGMQKFELKTYKSGQLVKLPREALTRAEELRGTARVAVDVLRRLKVPLRLRESCDSVVLRAVELQCPRPVVMDGLVVTKGDTKKVTGSIACRHFGEDELARLKGGYLSLSEQLLGREVLVAESRKLVKEEDLAVFLMLLRFFTANMNADGSLPTDRWKEMWKALFEAGDVDRAWCHHRFAKLRNFLSDKGLLSWEDESFIVGVVDEGGRFVQGRAAKWRAAAELVSMMGQFDDQEVAGVVVGQDFETHGGSGYFDSSEIVRGDVEGKEGGKSILYGCKRQDLGQTEVKEEGEFILYGYNEPDQDHEKEKEGGGSYNDSQQRVGGRKEKGRSILYGCTTRGQLIHSLLKTDNQPFLDVLDHLGIVMPLQKPRFLGYSTGQLRKAA